MDEGLALQVARGSRQVGVVAALADRRGFGGRPLCRLGVTVAELLGRGNH